MSTKNVNAENATEAPTGAIYRELPAPRDISAIIDAETVIDAVARQFDAGATAVVLHDDAGRTARVTSPHDVTTAGDCIVLRGDNGATATVPAATITIAAGTTAEHADLPLGTRVSVTYDPQNSQHDPQERTGEVVNWLPTRSGSVYKLGIRTDAGDVYHVWATTGAVEKGPQRDLRKVGHNASVKLVEDEDGDA
jgi:hypothetical protein